MKRLLALAALALSLVGCGADDGEFESAQAEPLRSNWLNHGTKLVTVVVDGTQMLCIERQGKSGDYSSGQYAGLSCDWYGWHRKRERGLGAP